MSSNQIGETGNSNERSDHWTIESLHHLLPPCKFPCCKRDMVVGQQWQRSWVKL